MIPTWRTTLTDAKLEVRDYFDLMGKVATAYHNATDTQTKTKLRKMFLSMYDHITDQGINLGSCWGNFTHYGYSFRSLYTSYFLMKNVLREQGLLNQAENTLLWYAITKEVFKKPVANGIDMDSFNTQTTGRIASILMMEDTPEKLQYLRSFSRWIDYGCRPALGLDGAFKADGSAFHHRNNYPAYAVGGLDGATNMIYLLSQTDFAVSQTAHQTVKGVLQAMRFYCNKEYYPLAMSGRHPNGLGKLIRSQYGVLALAGTPDGKHKIDPDLAASYLRFVSSNTGGEANPEYMPASSTEKETKMKNTLLAAGFKAEPDPQGHLTLGYGSVGVHRRSNWSAVVRGHSRYLWAAEHYVGANLYGRYLAHGSMQIMTAPVGEDVSPATGGWQQEGFDWNLIPGTTTIRLPLDLLRANILNVDAFSGFEEMLYSDQSFAGGLTQNGQNGNFAMILHEHDKYNGSHRARKSWHSVDNLIVCLGSDIENINSEYPTQTTIFQLAAADPKAVEYWNNYKGSPKFWIDNFATGYYTPLAVKFEKNFPQFSRLNSTEAPTEGNWVSLLIEHGNAPKGAKYEYAVLPQTNQKSIEEFAKKPTYRVLQQDSNGHIVQFANRDIFSYSLFETPKQELPKSGVVALADTSCLIMWSGISKNEALLTVAQPDLALYRGASDEAFDKDGKRIERSIYSRPWISNDSGVIWVNVTLRGGWDIAQSNAACSVVSQSSNKTVIKFECRDGASYDLKLRKK